MMPIRDAILLSTIQSGRSIVQRLVPSHIAMRKITGDGPRGAKLVALAPGKSFDKWVDDLGHSKYLQFEVEG